jgi:hypothetical protein
MQRLNEVISEYVTRYSFEIGFSLVFVIYLLFLEYLGTDGSGGIGLLCFILPIGFLLLVVTMLPRDEIVFNWLLVLPIGFVAGWIIRKLLVHGTSGRIILGTVLLINSIGFWYWFWTTADLGP